MTISYLTVFEILMRKHNSNILALYRVALIFILASIAICFPPEINAQQACPQSIYDLLVVENADASSTIFISDEKSGKIFYYQLPDKHAEQVNLCNFKVYYESDNFKYPSGLAYQNGNLVVSDKESQVVYEIVKGDKLTERILFAKSEGAEFETPSVIAAIGTGEIAIAEKKPNRISYLTMSSPNGKKLKTVAEGIDDPRRILSIQKHLFVLTKDDKTIYKVSNLSVEAPEKPTSVEMLTKLEHVKDFAFHDNAFYLAQKNRVVIVPFLPSEQTADRAQLTGEESSFSLSPKMNASRIFITKKEIFLGDEENQTVWINEIPSQSSHLQAKNHNLYWLKSLDKTIYKTSVRSGFSQSEPNSLKSSAPINDTQILWSGQQLNYPNAITVDNDERIYISDRGTPAIYELSKNKELREVYSGPLIKNPIDLAIANKILYVLDKGSLKLLSFDLTHRIIREENVFEAATFPDKIAYDDNNLVTYNVKSKVLLSFVLGNEGEEDSLPVNSEWKVEEKSKTLNRGEKLSLSKVLGNAPDFSIANGVVYLLDTERSNLILLPLLAGEPSTIAYSNFVSQPIQVAADPNNLYFVENSRKEIISIPSLLPIQIYFEGGWTSSKIVDFYNYLFEKGILSFKKYTVEVETQLMQLAEKQELIPAIPSSLIEESAKVNSKFQAFFCKNPVNVTICRGTQGPLSLKSGQIIELPDIRTSFYTSQRSVILPLDTKTYSSSIFIEDIKGPLGRFASKFVSRGVSTEELAERLKNLNPKSAETDILNATEGQFVIPTSGVRIFAVALKRDLLSSNSYLLNKILDKNVIGTSPSILSSPRSLKLASSAINTPRLRKAPAATVSNKLCKVIDPNMLSDAMRLVHYCLPGVLIEDRFPDVGVIDNRFNSDHPIFKPASPENSGYTAENSNVAVETNSNIIIYKDPEETVDREVFNADNDANQRPNANAFIDKFDHGTHIAALIGGYSNSKSGFTGFFPGARLYAIPTTVKIGAEGTLQSLKLFNLSIGENKNNKVFANTQQYIENIQNRPSSAGLYVVAAGNDPKPVKPKTLAFLGTFDNVLVVGATDTPKIENVKNITILRKDPQNGSSYGNRIVGLMAPGESIKSALSNGNYGLADGTSQATAIVTGAAAILMTVEPSWRPWQIKFRLVASADLWTDTIKRDYALSGLLNVERAVLNTKEIVLTHENFGDCKGSIAPGLENIPLTIKKSNGTQELITFKRLLRLSRNPEDSTTYTIIYYEERRKADGFDRYTSDLIRLDDIRASQITPNTFSINSVKCGNRTVSFSELTDFLNTFYHDDSNN